MCSVFELGHESFTFILRLALYCRLCWVSGLPTISSPDFQAFGLRYHLFFGVSSSSAADLRLLSLDN